MIVVEGTPGAGKTTLLGRLLAALPGRVLVFPEAQPPSHVTNDRAVARALLEEDHARVTAAAALTAADPDLVVASDRCHLGVLAYRYALARSGNGTWRDFDNAVTLCEELGLGEGHRTDTVIVLTLPTDESLRRRAEAARDRRYRIWFDHRFLNAYNDFWANPAHWTRVPDRWTTVMTTVSTGWAQLLAALPDTCDLRDDRLDTELKDLTCVHGCTRPRSPVVTVDRGAMQLYPYALHQQLRADTVTCLRRAADLSATWPVSPFAVARGEDDQ